MGMSYQIDEQQQCIFVRLHEEITEWSLWAGLEQLWNDPKFQSHFARLLDGTGVRVAAVKPEFIEAVARDFRSKTGGKLALVAGDSPTMYDFFVRYRDSLALPDCRVFKRVEEAISWLGITR